MSQAEESSSRKRRADGDANEDSIAARFDELSNALKEREKDLEAREQDVARREQLVQEGCPGAPINVIHLNVGGRTNIAVTRRTLLAIPGSMLESRFSGKFDDSIEKDKDGNFFIDEDPDLFTIMLNCLRAKIKCNDPSFLPSSPEPRDDLDRMLHYYGALYAIYPLSLERTLGEAAGVREVRDNCPSFSVSTTSNVTFQLLANHDMHNRRIRRYVVKLGNCQAAQVGWINQKSTSIGDDDDELWDRNEATVFDCKNGQIKNEGVRDNRNERTATEGSEIECCLTRGGTDAYGDTSEPTITFKLDGTKIFEDTTIETDWLQVPAIMIHGEAEITEVNYEAPATSSSSK